MKVWVLVNRKICLKGIQQYSIINTPKLFLYIQKCNYMYNNNALAPIYLYAQTSQLRLNA